MPTRFLRENLNSFTDVSNHSFLDMVDIDGETVFVSSTCFLEPLIVEFFTTKASDSHVSWLISQVLVTQLSWALLNNSIVERLRLIELFSILGSILISVSISLSGPACAIPKSRVHNITRAIINKRLSRSIYIGLVLDV